MYLRCFIAIDIPGQIKNDIGELIEHLKKCNTDVKWVPYENIHITLKFLGKTPEELLPRIGDSLSNIVLSFEPFYIKIYGMGVFPSRRHPRVIWVGIEDSEIVKGLQKDVEDSMTLLGYQREERYFHPHLTVGRVRSPKGIMNLIGKLDNFTGKDFGSVMIQDVNLMHSELKPSGPRYSCLRKIPLGGKKNGR